MNLCKISEISLSWYYKHKKLIITNNIKEVREKTDYEIVEEYCSKYNKKYWYRMITMILRWKWIIFNHKKVQRIMKKYDLFSKVRKKNPYKQIARANKEHSSMKNILNREFSWILPYQKLWTDISYLYYNWTRAYISVLKDMVTWEVISHKVSWNLWIWFVLKTIKEAIIPKAEWVIIQSDQWYHYTHPDYQRLLRELWIIQSMSRKWNCLDNAPTESFFGHLKDEIDISWCKSLHELEIYIKSYIYHYNNDRPQWGRKKMTPVQYRNHLLGN